MCIRDRGFPGLRYQSAAVDVRQAGPHAHGFPVAVAVRSAPRGRWRLRKAQLPGPDAPPRSIAIFTT
eukprot:9528793-Alexandrium_andersonii.AAC.1